jgi:hypothetical protein
MNQRDVRADRVAVLWFICGVFDMYYRDARRRDN